MEMTYNLIINHQRQGDYKPRSRKVNIMYFEAEVTKCFGEHFFFFK